MAESAESVVAAGTLPVGYQLEEFRIEALLGRGGFGITYRAEDTQLHRPVAIKEYLPQEFAHRAEGLTVAPRGDTDRALFDWGLTRFVDEARVLAQFRHPNIVAVLRFLKANGTAYIVMEYEDGEDLERWFARTTEIREAWLVNDLLLPILDGLEQVHARGLLHRDIKPQNVFIRRNRTPVLIDFGASRPHGVQAASRATLTTIISAGYSPFEQYGGGVTQQGPWTDIYALGGTLYRVVTGTRPLDVIARMQGAALPPAAELGAGRFSQTLLAAIDEALRLEADRRPQSVADFRARILGKVARADGQSEPDVTWHRPPSAPPGATVRSSPEPAEPVPAAGRRWLPGVAAVAVVGVLGFGGVLGWDAIRTGSGEERLAAFQEATTLASEVQAMQQRLDEARRAADSGVRDAEREVRRFEADVAAARDAQRPSAESRLRAARDVLAHAERVRALFQEQVFAASALTALQGQYAAATQMIDRRGDDNDEAAALLRPLRAGFAAQLERTRTLEVRAQAQGDAEGAFAAWESWSSGRADDAEMTEVQRLRLKLAEAGVAVSDENASTQYRDLIASVRDVRARVEARLNQDESGRRAAAQSEAARVDALRRVEAERAAAAEAERRASAERNAIAEAERLAAERAAAERETQRVESMVRGTWSGRYGYGDSRTPVEFSVDFSPTGRVFQGRMREVNTFGESGSAYLYASVSGQFDDGGFVHFTKTYDGTGGVGHSVRYDGQIQGNRIAGQWMLDGVYGTFEMYRN